MSLAASLMARSVFAWTLVEMPSEKSMDAWASSRLQSAYS